MSPQDSPMIDHRPDAESAIDGIATRRGFLSRLSALAAALSAFIVGTPVAGALLSPRFRRPPKKDWVKVALADDIDIETPVKVDFTETINDAWVQTRTLRTVWLFTQDGEKFTAFSGMCTHLGCAFGVDIERKVFQCPCHRGVFDMKTGAVLAGPPPRALDPLPVRVVDGAVQVILKQFRAGIPERIEV